MNQQNINESKRVVQVRFSDMHLEKGISIRKHKQRPNK